jgi:hypothetical protein
VILGIGDEKVPLAIDSDMLWLIEMSNNRRASITGPAWNPDPGNRHNASHFDRSVHYAPSPPIS